MGYSEYSHGVLRLVAILRRYLTLVRYCAAAFVCRPVAPGKHALLIAPPTECLRLSSHANRVVRRSSLAALNHESSVPVLVPIHPSMPALVSH
jgi:hypothetical protein